MDAENKGDILGLEEAIADFKPAPTLKKDAPKPKPAPKKKRRTKVQIRETVLEIQSVMATGVSKSAACEKVGLNIPSYNRYAAEMDKTNAAPKNASTDSAKAEKNTKTPPPKGTDPIATIQNSLAAIQHEVTTLKALGINIHIEFKK